MLQQTVNTSEKIITFSGRYVDPFHIEPEDIELVDIAHGLSMCCRYAGQCKFFYSVAQHSWLVGQMMLVEDPSRDPYTPEERMMLYQIALLHDASEAYIHDLCTATKRRILDYQKLEDSVQTAIFCRFGLTGLPDLPAQVKTADMRMLVTERRQIIIEQTQRWSVEDLYKPYPDIKIFQLNPDQAERMFLQACAEARLS